MTFEIKERAAAGRIGRFSTDHGDVTTPTLLPVINPNIHLVSPKEMQDRFGCQMVITNSYVLHKYDDLRARALERGVREVIDWDGPVMTDSGTFQMYVYGDVEVSPEDIVAFQHGIGVDVATCLDLFVTPDMSRPEAEQAVATTIERTQAAAAQMAALRRGASGTAGAGDQKDGAAANRHGNRADDPAGQGSGRPAGRGDDAKGGGPVINATVQGGIHYDLRERCADAYRDLDVGYHTIGGVVPVMEQQMYPELARMILHSQAHLRKDRPVHLFGAGHPLVFPLAVALGCDIFDSSSYAKYAKDGRMMVPEGTLHVGDLAEWPVSSASLDGWTPGELQKALQQKLPRGPRRGSEGSTQAGDGARAQAGDGARTHGLDVSDALDGLDAARSEHLERLAEHPAWQARRALAMHNLDVCFIDIRRIRQAIRDGALWELVEQRAACHPMLAHATKVLGDPAYQSWLEMREPQSGKKAIRYTGSLSHNRPMFRRIRERLASRITLLGERAPAIADTPYASEGEEKREVAMHKEPSGKPFGAGIAGPLDPEQDHIVINALGPTPLGLDEAYPFAQSVLPRLEGLDRGHMGWVGETKDAMLAAFDAVPGIPGPGIPGTDIDRDLLQVLRTADWQFGIGAGAVLTGLLAPAHVRTTLEGHLDDAASAALAIADAITDAGGVTGLERDRLVCERSRATDKMRTVHLDADHILSLRAQDALFTLKPAGARLLHAAFPAPLMRVEVDADSVAFNREGKSVFSRFVRSADPGLHPGDECLVVDEEDDLVAVGRTMLCAEEMADFESGMAVKVRDGIP